jgi:hypothetical protein
LPQGFAAGYAQGKCPPSGTSHFNQGRLTVTTLKSAAIFTLLGFLLASLTGSLRAAPDDTLGMALMSATVGANGTLVRGSGATSAEKNGTGEYLVQFARSIANCSCAASVGGNDPFVTYILTHAATANCPSFVAPDKAHIATSFDNTAVDRDFHLIVFCPK